jgi:DNA-binding LytR/AlgR family response regulator
MAASPIGRGTGMAVRALIVEDDVFSRRMLRDFAVDVDWLDIIGEATDGQVAVQMIEGLQPDLVFLDIKLPKLTGFQVLECLRYEPAIVFTTAYDRYAINAFELEAIDYLLKPIGRARFHQAMERVRQRLTAKEEAANKLPSVRQRAASALRQQEAEPLQRIFVRDARGKIIHLRIDEISRFIAADDYVEVHAHKTSYLVHLTLSDLEQRLDHKQFRRVHRSAIVNLDHVVSCEPIERRLLLKLRDGSEVSTSRAGSQNLQDLIL